MSNVKLSSYLDRDYGDNSGFGASDSHSGSQESVQEGREEPPGYVPPQVTAQADFVSALIVKVM